MLAVALGVALASSVQMINESALAEFSQALRAVNGQPDAVLAATGREGLADTIYARLALDESVALVSPVLEIDSQGRRDGAGVGSANIALRIVGVDALKVLKSSYRLKASPDANRPSTGLLPMGTFLQDYEYVTGLGDLDECNGRSGVTPEFPKGIYHYYATDTYPHLQRCVKGQL